MPTYRDQGVVLRTIKLGEADRIITILTAHHGKIRAVAHGVRRAKSRFGSRLEPFMRDDLLIAQGRHDLDTISQAVVISPYSSLIVGTYEAYLSASVIVETVDKMITDLRQTGISQRQQYTLVIGALAALAEGKHSPQMIENSYVLRALSLAGWTPRLDSCVVCGRRDQVEYFSTEAGGAMCLTHRLPRSHKASGQTFSQLGLLLAGDWESLDQQDLSPQVREIVEEWSQYYLEKPIHSLRLIHS